MIIVEGPDGSGKTILTEMLLANRVVEKILPSPRITAKGDPDRMKYETDRYLRLYGENNRIAIDRYLFSEVVYGPILRSGSVFTRSEYMTKLLELMLSHSIVIFCEPKTLNFKADENPKVGENIEAIKKAYKACSEDSAFAINRTYIYDWERGGAFDNLKKFIKELQ